jgi:hypothetical protein
VQLNEIQQARLESESWKQLAKQGGLAELAWRQAMEGLEGESRHQTAD